MSNEGQSRIIDSLHETMTRKNVSFSSRITISIKI